jgi:hypothetical protein
MSFLSSFLIAKFVHYMFLMEVKGGIRCFPAQSDSPLLAAVSVWYLPQLNSAASLSVFPDVHALKGAPNAQRHFGII